MNQCNTQSVLPTTKVLEIEQIRHESSSDDLGVIIQPNSTIIHLSDHETYSKIVINLFRSMKVIPISR